MIKVVNRHKSKEKGLYIGRGTVLGNPFKTTAAGGTYQPGETLPLYRDYLREEWKKGGRVRNFLLNLVDRVKKGDDLVLICSCKPKLCHGDVVKDVIETLVAKGF